MAIKGNINLEIDEQGIEVRVTITPDPNGADITTEGIANLLNERQVRAGIDSTAIDRALRTLAKKKTEPVSFVAAAGTPPQAGTPESILYEPCPIPERLAAVAARVLESAPPPRGFRLREERIKTERKVLKKGPLPFLPAREEIEVQVEKRQVREDVAIDANLTGQGYVTEGSLVARFRPGTQGKQGKNVFNRLVPAPRPEGAWHLVLEGAARSGAEVKATVTGFLRKGVNWCDVVPFRDHLIEVTASPDGQTCLLTFRPGDEAAPPPDLKDLLERAEKIGFTPEVLLPSHEIEAMLQDATLKGAALERASLSPTSNGVALVTVAADKLKAVLFLRKGRGGGRALTPAAVSEAIRASRIRGFDPQAVRKDLLAFFGGKLAELADYVLVSGRPPKPGSEPKIEWRAMFLPAEESETVRAAAASNPAALKSLGSLAAFPLARVEAVARVKKDAEIVRLTASEGGEPGMDVYGAAISPARPPGADLKLFEGLAMRQSTVVATEDGILEKGTDGAAILLRVRPHRDAEAAVTVSRDGMKAQLSFFPALGVGQRLSAADIRQRLEQAGVRQGIDEKKLALLLTRVAKDEAFADEVVAEGRAARQDTESRVVFHVTLATGKATSVRRDGSVDFRSQDRITRVQAGQKVATVKPRDPSVEDGWDVTGRTLTLAASAQETLRAGKGVREEVQADGSMLFVASATGELVKDGPQISVTEAHSVTGDVSMATGNVSFPGVVRISGSVLSGFTVMAGGLLQIGGTVEAALLSADGSIEVGQGIKGEGRAILRSKRDIQAMFAEQAVLLAIGDVRLRGSCVRCQVKCNGKLRLDSEKGSLLGGEIRASRGVEAQNIGSPSGARTVVSFGQDFLVKDQIEREEREVARLTKALADLDAELFVLSKRAGEEAASTGPTAAQSQASAMLARARAQKVQAMKLIETHKMRLITMRDRYEEHVPSEVVVRGTLYPGAVLESHGRRYETRTEKKMITLHFDPVRGAIVEKV
ncbi:MAG TPA: flagellar assembly protein A [Spirochaetia bacterium]|nr:flagellar assembly protein A [Spirochaetia bacterium]